MTIAFSAGALLRPLAGREQERARLEQPLRLFARALEHVGVAGDRAHRLDERLEEPRLARQLLLGRFVPPPLGDDQVRGEHPGEARPRRRQSPTTVSTTALPDRQRSPARAERPAAGRATASDREGAGA